MSWDRPTRPEAARALGLEERVRVRVHELAAASGLPVPDVQVGPHEHERRWLRPFRGTGRLVVSLDVAGAGPAEQDWALASALAHRSSRPARSRAWLGTGLVVGAPSVELVWRVLAAFDALDGLPYRKAVGIALVFVCSAMGLAGAAAFRSSTRAADAAAVDILIAAGRDPVSITRQVFRDTTRFAWWAYVWRPEPTDQSRIAAAERRGRTPAAGSAARIALGGDPPPPWWKRPHATWSSPRERIAAAERHRARPAPPLH